MVSLYRGDNFIVKINSITGIRFNDRPNYHYPTIVINTDGGHEYRIDTPENANMTPTEALRRFLHEIGWDMQ